MSNASSENFTLTSTNNQWSAPWRLTRCMKAAGSTTLASSNGASKDTSGVNANDYWGGGGSPLSDSIPAFNTTACWIVLSGATMLKLEMTAAGSAGSMIRGEPVTQATTGATGFFLGYSFDAGVGHAVIEPCTGTFNGSNVITGGFTGASFTPSALKTFVEEFLIAKTTNATQGVIARQIVDASAESASRFSVLATQSGCTGTVPPGGGGTSNAFPSAGTYMHAGGNSGAYSFENWFGTSNDLLFAKAQLVVANRTPAALTAVDSTWFMGIGNASGGADGFQWLAHWRLDDHEPADLDPHASFCFGQLNSNNANIRTLSTRTTTAQTSTNTLSPQPTTTGVVHWRGWRRRGFPTSDGFVTFAPTAPSFVATSASQGTPVMAFVTGTPQRIANTYKATPELKAFKIGLEAQEAFGKISKGSPRHLRGVQGLVTFNGTPDLLSKCFASQNVNGAPGLLLANLCDGTTDWLQA